MAVDSEHAKNIQQDMWRLHQLSKSILAPKSHPYSMFGSGNQQSLQKDDIQMHLKEFYQKYYRSSLGLYKLVVLGKESLSELREMVNACFQPLTDSSDFQDKVPPETLCKQWYQPVTPSWNVPQRIHLLPVDETHALELQFPLGSSLKLYQTKPTRYLSHLLGHEGKGSLLSLLKAKSYAQELYADDSLSLIHI